MAKKVKPIPDGYHCVTPYLVADDGARAVDFYRRALGATEVYRVDNPGGKIGHAELKINDSMIMLAGEMPQMCTRSPKSLGGSTAGIFLYVKDVDSVFNQAAQAGARVEMPVADMFWGDRYAARSAGMRGPSTRVAAPNPATGSISPSGVIF